MKFAGYCLGASRVGLVVLEKEVAGQLRVVEARTQNHDGHVVETLRALYLDADLSQVHRQTVTGRKFRAHVPAPSISEAEAIEYAYGHLKEKYPAVDTIVSAGAEAFLVYKMDKTGRIIDIFTGNKCASGTGEFFLQQIKRMRFSVEEAMQAVDMDSPYQVAGRCSVFCKSDCTHALNKGEAKSRVVGGLCLMMAGKISELVRRGNAKNILLIGGTAQNGAMVEFLRGMVATGQKIVVPEEGLWFEAFGAALQSVEGGGAAWKDVAEIRTTQEAVHSFEMMPDMKGFSDRVTFKSLMRGAAKVDDVCIIGLDVGSTTTKAVVMRVEDDAVLASVYLRTNGDPVQASRECYRSLAQQLSVAVHIVGLGVTGSGRQIAGIHAGSEGIVNEIIAHATAAAFFDPEVNTLFEIGGQDAKYTYITNGVPTDYAMNEACSAGTGSFLEEAAKEALQIEMESIADLALQSGTPLNFNDQCAAFIGSDIKTAIQEGVAREDIIAGLVYSVCQNYANRVKGNRPVGDKVFMQGGVCYNRAVPMAMAALTGKAIIVAPEPGLMGAYGVALVIKNKQASGLLTAQHFDPVVLADRLMEYGASFVCAGGPEHCDRKCEIKLIRTGGKELPFGGACNRYVNLRRNVQIDVVGLDWVRNREKLVFGRPVSHVLMSGTSRPKRIGLLKSLVMHSLFPLFYTYFTELGHEVILADRPDPDGMGRTGAAFCYPVELAHCLMQDMMLRETDFIFLPHIIGLCVTNGIKASVNCPLLQGEPYYLRSAFPEAAGRNVLSPTLDFNAGFESMAKEFASLGRSLGGDKLRCLKAWQSALSAQTQSVRQMKEQGRILLEKLEASPEKIGVVLFGRSYSAFAQEANLGVPHKFASQGQLIIPWEYLSYDDEEPEPHMFWSIGQMMLKAAKLTVKHPQLFAAYITNFSCGPDSFVVGYFRDIMGKKPALILELDSHVADAGIDTRIEAFLDVVASYRELQQQTPAEPDRAAFRLAEFVTEEGEPYVVDSRGVRRKLIDPQVHLTLVSMGRIHTRLLAAAFRHVGIRTDYLQPPQRTELNRGRANATCKECLPYVLVAGNILEDYEAKKTGGLSTDEVLVYFVPDSSGPCRFGQYHIAIRKLFEKKKMANVTIFSPTSDNGFAGLTTRFQNRAWQSVLTGDVLAEIYSALLVLADDRDAALATFETVVAAIEAAIADPKQRRNLTEMIAEQARVLAGIPLKASLAEVPRVSLLGEIYVRTDGFSRQNLVERLADKGIVVQVAPVSEYMYFCDYLMQQELYHVKPTVVEKMMSVVRKYVKGHFEKTIKEALAKSGLYVPRIIDIEATVDAVRHLIPPHFTAGETVLTVGSTVEELLDRVSGVISLSPFGCMPGRVGEAILTESLNAEKLKQSKQNPWVGELMERHPSLPFLCLESDGNPFPQIIEAKLELFCLQVLRVHATRNSLGRLRACQHAGEV